MSSDDGKRAAAARAALLVEAGMRLGLGTGSTASLFVEAVGARVGAGLEVVAVPTSEATRRLAERCGIRLATLEDLGELDLTVDGADEVDPDLDLIKGGGGALLREKLVAAASRAMVVIADEGKLVPRLGRFPLPVEVVSFGWESTARRIGRVLQAHGQSGDLRLRLGPDGHPFRTDGSHLIVDLHLESILDPPGLASTLKSVIGVVEHGLFIRLAARAIIGSPDGVVEHVRPGAGPAD